jgi:hypothetical protein
MNQVVKLRLDQGDAKNRKMEKKNGKKDAVCNRFYSSYPAVNLPRNLLQVLQTSKYLAMRNMQITFSTGCCLVEWK